MAGHFVISLDFELHWGAPELWDLEKMRPYFDATRQSIPNVLSLFAKYEISATWATVGFLFAKNKQQLLDLSPQNRPTYQNRDLFNYRLIDDAAVGEDEARDPYHFAPSLIQKIIDTPRQELGSHTFSHYYCNENGQNAAQFDADLNAAQAIARENFGVKLQSLVFPRNQFNATYRDVAKANGFRVVRTNPDVWFWNMQNALSPLARAFDTLLPISKTTTFEVEKPVDGMLELRASRFLRPHITTEKAIRQLKLNRILAEMTFAAKHGRCYHLWWHPHNFGYQTSENMRDLEMLLAHFSNLNAQYGFRSSTMLDMYKSQQRS